MADSPADEANPPGTDSGLSASLAGHRPARAVFLSYASEDAEAAARICDALRRAGVEVWFDREGLRGGDAWDSKIKRQIHECTLFMPLISAHTNARTEGYFRREWKQATRRLEDIADDAAFLVPVVIDGTAESAARVPEVFLGVHWTRLRGGEAPPAFAQHVLQLLGRDPVGVSIAGAAAMGTIKPGRQLGPNYRFRRLQLRWLGVGLPALVLLGLGGGLWWYGQSKNNWPTANPLAASSVSSAAPYKQSIAVLPFSDMSAGKDQEYFADGMAEEILNLLVRIPELKVIGRTSSFQFKGKTHDLRQIGSALNTAYVVEGSVRRSGDRVRVTAQLIDTRDGMHRWSNTYDREASDVFEVQAEIAANLVRELQLEVVPAMLATARSSPKSSEAYDNYLRGLHASNRHDQPGYEEAVAAFRRALKLDPTFAPAATALAATLRWQASNGYISAQKWSEEARAAARLALQIDPESAQAHGIMGLVHLTYDWDWPAAQRELKRALELSPNDPEIVAMAARERMTMGRLDEALQLLDTAVLIDPFNPNVLELIGNMHAALGRLSEAEDAYHRMLEISPSYSWGHAYLASALLLGNKAEEALMEMQKETDPAGKFWGMALAFHELDRPKDADVALASFDAAYGREQAFYIAGAYAFRGQNDRAFEWLERAYAQKDANLWIVQADPLVRKLNTDPRYKTFLRKMNLPT